MESKWQVCTSPSRNVAHNRENEERLLHPTHTLGLKMGSHLVESIEEPVPVSALQGCQDIHIPKPEVSEVGPYEVKRRLALEKQ